MIQPILGIDIAKETFDVTLILGEKSRNEHFDNHSAGYKSLSGWIEKYAHERRDMPVWKPPGNMAMDWRNTFTNKDTR